MKVLHITPSFFPASAYGGPVESLRLLTQALVHKDVDVVVLTTDADGHGRLQTPSNCSSLLGGVRVKYLPRWFGQSVAPGLIWEMVGEMRAADVVHLTAVYSFPTLPTLFLARVLGKPLVWSPRGALMSRANASGKVGAKRIWAFLCRSLAPPWTILHGTSDDELAQSREVFPFDGVVVPNSVEVPQSTAVPATGSLFRILFVGRLAPIKGLENLLDACSILLARGDREWTLTIAGNGAEDYVETLERRAVALGLHNHVTFVGQVSGVQKERLFQESSCLVLPSQSENFGMVVAEALSRGIPVIASTGTPWNELKSRGCGLWVSNEPSSLSEALSTLRGENLAECGVRGRTWMRESFSTDAVATQMCGAYSRAHAQCTKARYA